MKNNTVKSIILKTLSDNLLLSISLVLCAIAIVVTGLIPPLILRQVIDYNLVVSSQTGLPLLTLSYVLVLFGIGIADFLKGLVLTTLGQKISYRLRSISMAKMHRLNPLYFTKTIEGETVSRIINDTEAIDVLFTGGIVSMAIDLFKIIGIILSIFILSNRIGLVSLGLIPLIVLITRVFQRGMLKAQKRSRTLIGLINQKVAEALRNILVVKANGQQRTIIDRFKETLKAHYFSNEDINIYDSLFPVVIQIVKALSIVLFIISFVSKTQWFTISIGSIAAAIELISNLFDPIENVGSEMQTIQQAVAAIDRLDEYLAQTEEEPRDLDLKIEDILKEGSANLSFKNVSFYYEANQSILKNIDLDLEGGQQVTFVGRTGVGKSTLLKLVMGLLPPTEGCISLNNIDVFRIPHSAQRRIYGSVDQNFPMITGTLKQQLTLHDPSITSEMVINALIKVGLEDLCTQADKGIDAMIPLELQISEGQKQLIAIARAIVTDPPILILDEISSGLDSISSAQINDILKKVSKNRIVLSVTHRLSSISDDEMIVILQDGKIRKQGLASELKESDAWFRKAIQLEQLAYSNTDSK